MDDDDDDSGAPPAFHGRVWTNPSGKEILTEEEKRNFDIEGQKARRRAQLAAAGLALPEQPTNGNAAAAAMQAGSSNLIGGGGLQQQSAGSRWLELLVAKFPQYDPSWPPELQARWFESFERLLAKGAAL